MPDYQTRVSALVYNHQLAKSSRLDTLTRIIQQSRVPHVAGFNAICELIIRYGSVTHSTLVQWSNETQVNKVAQLAAILIHNPLVTLAGPAITVAQYPDIAYLATEIMYNTRRRIGRNRDQYVSSAEGKLTRSVPYIKSMADRILNLETAQAAADTALVSLFAAHNMSYVATGNDGSITYRAGVQQGVESGGDFTIRPDQVIDLILRHYGAKDTAFKRLRNMP
ncbi:hypothetical protein GQX74_012016 [Glossina fuscipes]|nr:hypothetical protein GQX74_012016 [Glossina fuscipes]